MYYLLPFRFHVMHGKELLINDLGDFLVVPRGSVGRIVNREIDTDVGLVFHQRTALAPIDRYDGSPFGYQKSVSRPFHGPPYLRVDVTMQSELHLLPSVEQGEALSRIRHGRDQSVSSHRSDVLFSISGSDHGIPGWRTDTGS